jgi:hypothetical protein
MVSIPGIKDLFQMQMPPIIHFAPGILSAMGMLMILELIKLVKLKFR